MGGLRDDQSKETSTAEASDSPPSYRQAEAQSLELPTLDLTKPLEASHSSTITPDQCIAHLKFLAVLADLRDTISNDDGLFGIYDAEADNFPESLNEVKARIREKRWAVYTARAVDRYTRWWFTCVPSSNQECTMQIISSSGYENILKCDTLILWNNLPPVDVLMVWHSHMLNPRSFLEDCIRYGKLSHWKTGFPWDNINRCISDRTLDYTVNEKAQEMFTQQTHLKWANLHDPPTKGVVCPRCTLENMVPWTEGGVDTIKDAFRDARGYADNGFLATCTRCQFLIDHERLKVAKFRNDVEALLHQDRPMPGSFYNINGVPEGAVGNINLNHRSMTFPSRLIEECGNEILSKTDARLDGGCKTISNLRDELEKKLRNHKVFKHVYNGKHTSVLRPGEKVHFRRMMSRYWDNLGPFALDLVGAVIRQGTFVQKMDNIDWLHSPTVRETATRIIMKYRVFFDIMVNHPQKMAVPTLDVDLAWHTHQLMPSRYYEFSTSQRYFSRGRGTTVRIFIDHDDKVDEGKLSDGFEWTSKMYRHATNGDVYSECTCWYCEATRAPDLYDRLFAVGSASRARNTADNLHDRPDVSSDPERNPHISAHNAVRVTNGKLQQLRLQRHYEMVVRRAEKRGRNRGDSKSRNGRAEPAYATPLVWGYPIMVPYYAPYMADPCINADSYPCNPSCMSIAGNCAAGTCTGAVAAGSCGGLGSGGGCAGGGSFGGCGGGGAFGGCGGGGGGGFAGCGGGGGGGFGGCGGGGGGGC